MRMLLAASVAALTFGVAAPPQKAALPEKPIRLAMACFKSGEQTSGTNRICYYDCAGSQAAVTVSIAQICPLSINR